MNQENILDVQKVSTLSLSIVVVLYLAHALPLYFYNVALPVILRHQGVDLRWIGMLSLLYIPWAFKFIWAPLIDRFYFKVLGKRKTWLLLTQIALVFGVISLALTEFDYGLTIFIMVGLWISIFAATQDIAIDGYNVETFLASDSRLGSMAQSMGIALGSMIGGAAILWFYQLYNWRIALMSLAIMIALTMLAIFQIKEKSDTEIVTKSSPSLIHAFKRPAMLWTLKLIVCYRIIEAPAMAMLNPMLVDQKWSLSEIAMLMSVIGTCIGFFAAVFTAFLLKKLAAIDLLIWVGWVRTVLYVLLAIALLRNYFNQWRSLLAVFVVAILAIRYTEMTALYTHFMQISCQQQAGTDFTILVCFELLIYFIGAAVSGFLAQAFGYGSFYLVLAIASMLSILLSQVLIFKVKQIKKIV